MIFLGNMPSAKVMMRPMKKIIIRFLYCFPLIGYVLIFGWTSSLIGFSIMLIILEFCERDQLQAIWIFVLLLEITITIIIVLRFIEDWKVPSAIKIGRIASDRNKSFAYCDCWAISVICLFSSCWLEDQPRFRSLLSKKLGVLR